MKNIILSLALLISSITVCTAQQKKFTAENESFSIIYPDSWTLIDKKTMPILEFGALAPREDTDDKFSENINVVVDSTQLAGEKSLKEYTSATLNGIKPILKDFEFESQGEDIVTNKIAASYYIYKHKTSNLDLKVLTFLCKSNNRVYVITCSAEANRFKDYKGTFLGICRSISFN